MDADRAGDLLHRDVTNAALAGFFRVYNHFGHGFLEGVYANALASELSDQGFRVRQQVPIDVWYFDRVVGEFRADLMVNDLLIIEVKACASIVPAHLAQLLNYLKATKMPVGLLLNFGPKAEFRRKVLST